MAPMSRSVEPSYVAPGWDVADLNVFLQAVVKTITQARAYALKWSQCIISLKPL